jgi:hypothetical protein
MAGIAGTKQWNDRAVRLNVPPQEAIARTLAGTMPAAKGGSMTSKVKTKKPAAAKPATGKAKKAAPGREGTGGSKQETLLMLLRRANGASIAELAKATGWQDHSVRGALSGLIKKKLGHKVQSARKDGVRRYRIAS